MQRSGAISDGPDFGCSEFQSKPKCGPTTSIVQYLEYNADQMIVAVDYRLGGKRGSEVVVLRRIRSRRLHVLRLLKPADVPIS
jgi:hypothetical protein